MRIRKVEELKPGEPYLFLMAQPHERRGLECIWSVLVLKGVRSYASGRKAYLFINPVTERPVEFLESDLLRLMVFRTLHDALWYVQDIIRRALGSSE